MGESEDVQRMLVLRLERDAAREELDAARGALQEAISLLERSHPPSTPDKNLWVEWLDDVHSFLIRQIKNRGNDG